MKPQRLERIEEKASCTCRGSAMRMQEVLGLGQGKKTWGPAQSKPAW